jgi:ATP-binding cassette subfamily F protein uup
LRQETQVTDPIEASPEAPQAAPKPAPLERPRTQTGSRKLSWKEQRELETLEAQINELEAAKRALAANINTSGADFLRLQALTNELERVQAELATAEERWLELSEIAQDN